MISRRRKYGTAFILFIIGMFAMTQIRIVGKIGISELFLVLSAPFVFLKNYSIFVKDRVIGFFGLIILWIIGAIFSDYMNGSYFANAIRGVAAPIVVFSACACLYVLLRKNIYNLKWLLFGIAVSSIISIFVFQRGYAGDAANATDAIDRVVGYKLFWVGTIRIWVSFPIAGWFTSIPVFLSCIGMLSVAIVGLFSGGRSSFLAAFVSFILLVIAGRTERKLKFLKQHMILFIVLLMIIGYSANKIYKFSVKNGYLGENELTKYEGQTKEGSSILALLVSGRAETFVGLYACLERPLLGFGSWALDYDGYWVSFMEKYGNEDDYKTFASFARAGMISIIPAHSHIVQYWLWHGIFGLVFWLYAGYLVAITLIRRTTVCPSLYGYLAVTVPAWFWDFFFSPLGWRVSECALFVVCLLIRKIRDDKRKYGFSMVEMNYE